MKTLFTIAAFFAFTAISFGQAQEEHERLQQQPPPVTQKQVEKHAEEAQEMREANPRQDAQLKKQQKEDLKANKRDAATTGNNSTAANTRNKSNKTSTRPDKQ